MRTLAAAAFLAIASPAHAETWLCDLTEVHAYYQMQGEVGAPPPPDGRQTRITLDYAANTFTTGAALAIMHVDGDRIIAIATEDHRSALYELDRATGAFSAIAHQHEPGGPDIFIRSSGQCVREREPSL